MAIARYALGRPEAAFDLARLRAFYAGKRVLITGAGGSIGAALALKFAELGCAHLALLDHFDHGLIEVMDAVRRAAPRQQIADALCDIRDVDRLESWMRRIEPDVVLHSAALKHVQLGERHPVECVLTNLVGVRNTLAAAANAGVRYFTLVSSDKAAAPVCVMGATKRLAELHLAGFHAEHPAPMHLKSVRFANVLGSQGSVLPRFAAQIESGGPIELTHPEMQRYFMSPDEAVGLILSVTALDGAEGCYIMEMGAPTSILELGREMIRRSGKDIEIEITGLRPGERIKEQLSDEAETLEPSPLPGVFRVTPNAYVTSADIAHLETMARTMDDPIVRQRVLAFLDQRLQRDDRATG